MKSPLIAICLLLIGSATLLDGATISISKDVRFTVGTPKVLFQEAGVTVSKIVATRDGGRLIGGVVWVNQFSQNADLLIRRTDSAGVTLWAVNIGTNDVGEAYLAHEITAITETPSGDIVVLESRTRFRNSVARMIKLSSAGVLIRETWLGFGECGGFSSMVADRDGYILGGTSLQSCFPASGFSTIIVRLAADFSTQWEKAFFAARDSGTGVVDLKRTGDGGLIFITRLWANVTVKARADGTVEWMMPEGGDSSYYVDPVGVYPLRDGGYAMLYSSSLSPGGPKSALNYGAEDYWIVRVNANGQKLWDRSYGGIGREEPLFLTQTEDDGFIVGGYSRSVGISGNKGVPGEGTWCLKLDSRGLKEAEFMLPDVYANIFPKAAGYSLVGSQPNAYTNLVSVDINALRRVGVTARPVDSKPFNLDVSTNLTTWTPLVIGFTGELNLLERFDADRKFYRVTDQ